jgi:hypothetical protein
MRPGTASRRATPSRGVPALSPQWEEWVADNLTRGVMPEVLEAALRGAGLRRRRAAAAVRSIGRHPAVVTGRRLCSSHGELLSLLNTRSALFRRLGERRVERHFKLPPEVFFEEYYFTQRPVVLQGLTEDWPAMERWRPERLAERFGDVEVEVMAERARNPNHDVLPDRHRRMIRLADFIRQLHEGPTNDFYLTARNKAFRRSALHALLEDIRVPEGYMRPWKHPREVRLWIGPAGTRTALHHDMNALLLIQIHGRKHFWLVPSYEMHRVYNNRGVWCDVDPARPDLRQFPAYRDANALEVVLQPGEALFLPMGWWHQVLALDVSVMLTLDSFAVPGGLTYWAVR